MKSIQYLLLALLFVGCGSQTLYVPVNEKVAYSMDKKEAKDILNKYKTTATHGSWQACASFNEDTYSFDQYDKSHTESYEGKQLQIDKEVSNERVMYKGLIMYIDKSGFYGCTVYKKDFMVSDSSQGISELQNIVNAFIALGGRAPDYR